MTIKKDHYIHIFVVISVVTCVSSIIWAESEQIKDGNYTLRYPNGQIQHQTTYKNGLKSGPAYNYLKDGRILMIEQYTNGLKTDVFENNFGKSTETTISSKSTFEIRTTEKDTVVPLLEIPTEPPLNGVWKVYYESGALRHLETYTNGLLHGDMKSFAPDGTLTDHIIFENGDVIYEWKENSQEDLEE